MARLHVLLAVALLAVPSASGAQRPLAGVDTLDLSLGEAVRRALRAGDEVRRAAAEVDLADAQVTTARASGLPLLRVSGGYTHVIENARAQAVGQIFNQPNTYTVNANLSHPIFQGGRAIAGWRAARRTREAARLNAEEARADVTLGVLRAYLLASLADRVAHIRGENLAIASARVGQAEQLFTSGRIARYDVLRSRVERANLEPLVIAARNDQEMALLELRRLLNLPADAPLRLTTTIDSAGVAAVLASTADSGAGDVRASVRAAERTVQARRAAVAVARADWLPTVNVFLQSGYQAFPPSGFPPGAGRVGEDLCPPGSPAGRTCQNGGWFSDRSIGLTFTWPLFDGLRAKGNMDIARAQLVLAEIALAQEREAVALEVAGARAELHRAGSVYLARRQNALEADEAFRLASLRYARGLSTSLEVSDSQLALLTAHTDEAQGAVDLYLATAELARALGRPIPLPGGAFVTPSAAVTDAPTR